MVFAYKWQITTFKVQKSEDNTALVYHVTRISPIEVHAIC